MITEKLRDFSRDQVTEKLDGARIAYGRVSDLDDLANHPQNRYRKIEAANGIIKALGRGAEAEGKVERSLRLPAIGEHSEQIREEFSN